MAQPRTAAERLTSVFELKRGANAKWTESVIHGFSDTADGVNPEAPVVKDSTGNLFGTTVFGGGTSCAEGFGCGEVFELSQSGTGTWTKTLVHAFTDTPDGHAPMAGLTFNKAAIFLEQLRMGAAAGRAVCLSWCHSPVEVSRRVWFIPSRMAVTAASLALR
jgi:hypothetical protein